MIEALRDKKFKIFTFGCRTNHYESEALVSMLEERGCLYLADGEEAPDLVILMTCSLTAVADAKMRKSVRRFRRNWPQTVIVVAGCYAESSADQLEKLGANLVVGNRVKHEIPALLQDFFTGGRLYGCRLVPLAGNNCWDALRMNRPRIHGRAFVKVQDGCDRRCSYCIVPLLRGKSVSRPPDDFRAEIARIVESGCREVVLTGIHLGSYRYDGEGLESLLEVLAEYPGLRVRFGSVEPFALDDSLLAAMAALPGFCRHLHIPLQSGDDGVLSMMKRGYTVAAFSRLVERARRYLGEDLHLSTDLMVGFPRESDEAFHNSLNLLRELGFGRVHVFSFSPRPGTAAGSLARLPDGIVTGRSREALELADSLLQRYASRMIGREDSFLGEKIVGNFLTGWTTHYLRALIPQDEGQDVFFDPAGSILREYVFTPKRQIGGILLPERVPEEEIGELRFIDEG